MPPIRFRGVKASFVTWQLRRLHAELSGLDKQHRDIVSPVAVSSAKGPLLAGRDSAARRSLVTRFLRSLPRRLGYRNARAFAHAFARANCLTDANARLRRRLSVEQVRELERRVMNHECPSHIALAIGCAEQTVLNRATQLRKRLSAQRESEGSGI